MADARPRLLEPVHRRVQLPLLHQIILLIVPNALPKLQSIRFPDDAALLGLKHTLNQTYEPTLCSGI
jgi:hypothetical protein